MEYIILLNCDNGREVRVEKLLNKINQNLVFTNLNEAQRYAEIANKKEHENYARVVII
jgi:hypothetical protein